MAVTVLPSLLTVVTKKLLVVGPANEVVEGGTDPSNVASTVEDKVLLEIFTATK